MRGNSIVVAAVLPVVLAAGSAWAASDGTCPPENGAAVRSLAMAVDGAETLTSAPSPTRFAQVWGDWFDRAVRSAAGTDSRLSLKEAQRLAAGGDDLSRFGDNAVNWLDAAGQKSVSVDKLIAAGRAYALAKGKLVAGPDGRISFYDAMSLPADLRDDFRFLRGYGGTTPPPPTPIGLEARSRAALASLTGFDEPISVLGSTAQAGGATKVSVAIGRGTVSFVLSADNQVSHLSITAAPPFVDPETAGDIGGTLNQDGIAGTPAAIGVAADAAGGTLWHVLMRNGNQERTVAIRFTATGSQVVPYAYDVDAFRQMAVPLVVEHALDMVEPGADAAAAKLQIYLRGNQLLNDPSQLTLASPGTSPIGFDPATQAQLEVGSMYGDNAVFVTVDKPTGDFQVDDFN